MNALKINQEDQFMMWSLIAVILHLGAIHFQPEGDHCKIADPSLVATIAGLLNTDAAAVTKALTVRVVAAKGEVYETKLV